MAKFFFYGTLKSTSLVQYVNTDELHTSGVHEGTVRGRLFMIAAGEGSCFPALKLGGRKVVKGEVVEVPEEMILVLDRIEGYKPGSEENMYERKEIETCEGERVWVYEWCADDSFLTNQIEHGSFDHVGVKTSEGKSMLLVPMEDPEKNRPCVMYWPQETCLVEVNIS